MPEEVDAGDQFYTPPRLLVFLFVPQNVDSKKIARMLREQTNTKGKGSEWYLKAG
jgi:hypothetical protein